jgi:hypothetical protein
MGIALVPKYIPYGAIASHCRHTRGLRLTELRIDSIRKECELLGFHVKLDDFRWDVDQNHTSH